MFAIQFDKTISEINSEYAKTVTPTREKFWTSLARKSVFKSKC